MVLCYEFLFPLGVGGTSYRGTSKECKPDNQDMFIKRLAQTDTSLHVVVSAAGVDNQHLLIIETLAKDAKHDTT
eukprot:2957740-Amphidinium_carterae.1